MPFTRVGCDVEVRRVPHWDGRQGVLRPGVGGVAEGEDAVDHQPMPRLEGEPGGVVVNRTRIRSDRIAVFSPKPGYSDPCRERSAAERSYDHWNDYQSN